jgi:hypothetical protein
VTIATLSSPVIPVNEILDLVSSAAHTFSSRTDVEVPEATQTFAAGVLFARFADLDKAELPDPESVHKSAVALFDIALETRQEELDYQQRAAGGVREIQILDLAHVYFRWPYPFGKVSER